MEHDGLLLVLVSDVGERGQLRLVPDEEGARERGQRLLGHLAHGQYELAQRRRRRRRRRHRRRCVSGNNGASARRREALAQRLAALLAVDDLLELARTLLYEVHDEHVHDVLARLLVLDRVQAQLQRRRRRSIARVFHMLLLLLVMIASTRRRLPWQLRSHGRRRCAAAVTMRASAWHGHYFVLSLSLSLYLNGLVFACCCCGLCVVTRASSRLTICCRFCRTILSTMCTRLMFAARVGVCLCVCVEIET